MISVACGLVGAYNFLKACYVRIVNSKRNIVITLGSIGTVIFGYLTWSYLDIVPRSLFPVSLYISIYYSIGILLAVSIGFVIVALLNN